MFAKIILSILSEMIKKLSPQIRQQINKFLDDLEKQAQQTKSPYDDIFVKLIKAIFNF